MVPLTRKSLGIFLCAAVVWLGLLAGCASRTGTPQERYQAAQTLFEQTTKEFHLPSAQAKGQEQEKLRAAAADGYAKLLKRYPDQEYWAAQALRSLGNIRASQGRLDDAVQRYRDVGTKYPGQEWEVVMAWKSAADLLWDAGRKAEAAQFYRQLVERFDSPDAPAVVKTAVRGSKTRLAEQDSVGTTQ